MTNFVVGFIVASFIWAVIFYLVLRSKEPKNVGSGKDGLGGGGKTKQKE